MEVLSGHAGRSGTMSAGQRRERQQPAGPWLRWAGWLEALGVVLSPAAAALVLRLRLMAPSVLPDPAIHTSYIVNPHDVFTRYAAALSVGARMREGGRVGFLVPARLDYLAFGAVPGFFVTRYLLALVAVVPVYLLLRRLYGPPAGVAGIVIMLSSPVLVTAWGTDYPDSAVVSYAAGALACLAMPCASRWRRAWIAAGGALLTLAVWSHGVAVPLVAATLAGYLGVRLARNRAGLAADVALLAGVAAAVTGLLALASAVLLGNANFIALTWQGVRYLARPSQTATFHSASWQWAKYVTYLLVPPAVLGAFAVAVARRARVVPVPVLLIGVAGALQLAAFAWLQFGSTVQDLEEHYFSSTLWGGVCLVLAITVAELSRPLADHPVARWLPAAVLLAIPLGYEAAPRVPALGWAPWGALLAAAVIAAAAVARGCGRLRRPPLAATTTGLALAGLAAAVLVLTVTPIPRHPPPPGTVKPRFDPAPAYATALGGSGSIYIDGYRIATSLPAFVGPAAYRGEQLLVWRLTQRRIDYLTYATGMYHSGYNRLKGQTPQLTAAARSQLTSRRPAEVLLVGRSAASFPTARRALAAYRPVLVRAGDLRSGPLVLHAWVLRLDRYYHPPGSPGR
ncbi:MAG TPA: glycosyltransferase family 39 protein [Streptosporangiaceae bacterium]|nr:glycosyltransferase family 39 protein [Streptosporangiaceae bacterium]